MRGLTAPLVKLSLFTLVTVLLTALLAMTVAASNVGSTSEYAAKFDDASGLGEGDEVRIAGVRVGEVSSLEVVDGTRALARFEIDAARTLPADAVATVKYRNLAGQRYLALDAALSPGEPELAAGATLPVEQTRPALNLTALFNGFQPLLQALEPGDVNKLSGQLIQVLQGEGGTVESILAHTASLTSTLAEKDQVIGQVIDNLNAVLGQVSARSPQLGELIDALQRLVSGFAEQREPIGDAVTALDDLTHTTADLLQDARPPLREDVAALGDLSANLNAGLPQLEHDVRTLPGRLDSLTRTVSYGSWFNFYLCRLTGRVGISGLDVQAQVLPLPPTDMPARCQP
ncbi:MlaD family protein [Saccharopolyspora gloriosae]|uniref:Phospholipid/cholesterol/gamma-HCH transport system substrate-binding protein n=1 Tax=Saccharopolyspora gloriosae TaxID=455344 RepID=A0A840NBN5_9PSEU|nr:MCE family protein [Saccharopolyspora gloriosae]MBB5069370.1 phospholipid/cholesterol/gamma-HCH transport system substrate-binding protein [Saccharopolyspora gloriosae]